MLGRRGELLLTLASPVRAILFALGAATSYCVGYIVEIPTTMYPLLDTKFFTSISTQFSIAFFGSFLVAAFLFLFLEGFVLTKSVRAIFLGLFSAKRYKLGYRFLRDRGEIFRNGLLGVLSVLFFAFTFFHWKLAFLVLFTFIISTFLVIITPILTILLALGRFRISKRFSLIIEQDEDSQEAKLSARINRFFPLSTEQVFRSAMPRIALIILITSFASGFSKSKSYEYRGNRSILITSDDELTGSAIGATANGVMFIEVLQDFRISDQGPKGKQTTITFIPFSMIQKISTGPSFNPYD